MLTNNLIKYIIAAQLHGDSELFRLLFFTYFISFKISRLMLTI